MPYTASSHILGIGQSSAAQIDLQGAKLPIISTRTGIVRGMQQGVFCWIHYHQIADLIIPRILIHVMHNFILSQWSSHVPRHYQPMLQDIAVAIGVRMVGCVNANIALGVNYAATFPLMMAGSYVAQRHTRLRAVHAATLIRLPQRNHERLSALLASMLNDFCGCSVAIFGSTRQRTVAGFLRSVGFDRKCGSADVASKIDGHRSYSFGVMAGGVTSTARPSHFPHTHHNFTILEAA